MLLLQEDLIDVLKEDSRVMGGGQLLKNKVAELALAHDAALLKLLFNNVRIKKIFFTQAGEVYIFNSAMFQQYINNKDFLPGSFTAFINKIGLTAKDQFINAGQDIILSWPYKDCILEGGQSREEKVHKENFFNEIISREEIDRLLHPKVFTNFKKYSSLGVEDVTKLSNDDNFIIRGNNLLVMYSLLPVYQGKIKLIYIDPPYNTGSDGFLYHDNFNHSTWLTFMKNRLEVAWKLLSPEGCIFIQIDDTEFAYLKVLCDEIFGRENFRENIVLKSSTESGVNAINVKRGERLFKVKEYILFYSKSPSFRFAPFYTKTSFNTNYKYEVKIVGDQYTVVDVYKKFLKEEKGEDVNKKNLVKKKIEGKLEEYALANPQNIYSLEKNIKKAGAKFKAFALVNKSKNEVEEFTNSSGEKVLIYEGGVLVPLRDRVIEDGGKNSFGVLASDLWIDIATTAATEGGIAFANGKKPEKLLKRIIEMATSPGDLILDYHLGSGTTAAVAHKLGRGYIGIEQMDYGENDAVVRLQNVINGDPSGISKNIQWKGGSSFIYCELKKLNQLFFEQIIDSQDDDSIKQLEKILAHAILDYRANKEMINSERNEFLKMKRDEKMQFFAAILDANMLYLPYTEIRDKTFNISLQEIKLNEQFYSLKIT